MCVRPPKTDRGPLEGSGAPRQRTRGAHKDKQRLFTSKHSVFNFTVKDFGFSLTPKSKLKCA